MIAQDFTNWLLQAQPGETCSYHSGRLHVGTLHLGGRERSQRLDELAQAVWDAAQGGFVRLTQRRLGADNYTYIATRTEEIAG